jgi:hypothetical protein
MKDNKQAFGIIFHFRDMARVQAVFHIERVEMVVVTNILYRVLCRLGYINPGKITPGYGLRV